MAKRSHQIKVEDLSRFLVYILGRKPDEFGLVPDGDGFVKIKELLQVLHEEPTWRYVRQSHINEVLMGKDRPLYQLDGKRIRVLEIQWQMDLKTPAQDLPGCLFTAVRNRAHRVVMEKGLKSSQDASLVLSRNEEMALRMGRRRDQRPVLLTVMAGVAEKQGVLFYPFGDLFLSPEVPVRFISGPPVSKEVLEGRKDMDTRKERTMPTQPEFTPGTFSLDLSRDPGPYQRAKGKKRKGWKEASRKIRRRKS